MKKRQSNPDRRGMGAQSDFIAEQFIPSDKYRAQQNAIAQKLIAAGMNPQELAGMFLVPLGLLAGER